jgi:S1-C subfamily serine protease
MYKDGYAKHTRAYDDRNNQTECAYFGTDGKPILTSFGHAKWTAEYDARGQKIRQESWGVDGKPILNAEGWFRLEMKYDMRGNMVENSVFDVNGGPRLNKFGYATWKAVYDGRNQQTEMTYYGVDDRPLRMAVVVSSIVPDGQGKRLGLAAGDVFWRYDGEPVVTRLAFIAQRRKEAESDSPRKLQVFRNGTALDFSVQPGSLGVYLEDRFLPPENSDSPKSK